jgi:hypothetical protein
MYKVIFLSDAAESFKKLDKPVQKKIAQKLTGLLKMRVMWFIIRLPLCLTICVAYAG